MTSTASLHVPSARAYAGFTWPAGFDRIPDEPWATQQLDTFGLQYDSVGMHTWYKNLEPTVAQALGALDENKLMVDYSSGTGILAGRLLPHISYPVGILNVDSSPKFLRVAVENFRDDDRVAFRLMNYQKERKRLQLLDEVVDLSVLHRGVDVLTSTNAIHLYYNLPETVSSWWRVMRPGGLVLMCSANVRNPHSRPGDWIIDETVAQVNELAEELVRTEPAFEDYRAVLEDGDRMARYRALTEKVFVPVRPLEYYLDTFEDEGFTVLHTYETTIHARVDEWHQLLSAYHEGVLGWFGGTERIEGKAPSRETISARLFLIKHCLEKIFPGKDDFPCSWTYITCRRKA